MKKILFFFPVILLFFSCSNDSSDDLPIDETTNSNFTVTFSQAGNEELFHQDITFYGSPSGWKDSKSGAQVEGYLNAKNEALPGSFSYSTKQASPAIWVVYNVTPFNVENNISLDVTFKFYKDEKLIDTKIISVNNESNATDTYEWKYFSDVTAL